MQRNKSLTQGPLFLNIITYTIPIILTGILQLLFNAADLVVVGRYCGSIYVAAVGATGAMTTLVINLFIGLSIGGGVTLAHAIGGRDETAMHRTVHTALPTALVGGVVLTVVGMLFSETFLKWMGTPEEVLPLSALYTRIYFGGILFSMVYNFCAALLRAAGDTKSPLIFLTIAGVINVILNVCFITLLHMNVDGVALATVISQGISAGLAVRALMRRTDACRLQPRKMHFYGDQLKKIVRQGLPAGIQGSLFSFSNVVIQSSVNSFGDIFMTGNAAADNIGSFVYVSMDAFHQTALNFTGQNVGANQYKRVGRIMALCLTCVAVTGFLVGGAAWLFGDSLLSIYITDSPEAIAYGMLRLTYVCIPFFMLGLLNVSTGILRGLGVSLIPMITSVLGVCGLRLVWIYTIFQIPQYHTPQCLYMSFPVSWILTFLAQLSVCLYIYRKRKNANRL